MRNLKVSDFEKMSIDEFLERSVGEHTRAQNYLIDILTAFGAQHLPDVMYLITQFMHIDAYFHYQGYMYWVDIIWRLLNGEDVLV